MLQADFMLDRHSSNAAVVYRDGSSVPGDAQGTGGYIQFPMIVLVDEETSGGAELIAAVLQDNHRALIAGRRTRGKASVQILIPLSSRGNAPQRLAVPLPDLSLKLTTGYMVRPSGRSLHRFAQSRLRDDWGVRPDPGFEIRLSPELSKHLKESWQLQDLRPGTSAEALPLDDPLADPQRQAAFQRLREMLRQQDQSHIRNP
jgi:carboxyl-terminal processing protease